MDESCSLIQEQLKTKYFSCFLFTLRPFYIALAQYEAAKWIQTSPHPLFLQDSIKYNRTKKKNPVCSYYPLHITATREVMLPLKCVNFWLKLNFSKNSGKKTALMCFEWNSFKRLWDLEDIYSFNPLYQNNWQNHNETFCSFLKTKTKEEKEKNLSQRIKKHSGFIPTSWASGPQHSSRKEIIVSSQLWCKPVKSSANLLDELPAN